MSDSTGARIGTDTRASASRRMSSPSPAPSLPNSSSVGGRRSTRVGSRAAPRHGGEDAEAAPTAPPPAPRRASRRPPPAAAGRCPSSPRSAFQPNGSALAPQKAAPVAPPASAARTTAPDVARFLHVDGGDDEGRRRGQHPAQRRVGPMGDGDDARRARHGTHRGHHRLGHLDQVGRRGRQALDERGTLGRRACAGGEGHRVEPEAGGQGVDDQVRAVEQQRASRLRRPPRARARQVATRG